MSEKVLITVVVPIYNVEKYLIQCLDSLLYQSEQNFKVILVNDGSTDSSGRIAENYAEKYPEIFRYIYQENAGLGAARNKGMQYVETPYIEFLDSDDWLMPRTIEHVTKAILEEPEDIDIIFMKPKVYNMATCKYEEWKDNELLSNIFARQHIASPAEIPEMYALEANINRSVWNTSFLKKYNFSFPEGVKWEDVFPHFYLFYWARRCIMVNEAGFFYRINSGNQITSMAGAARLDIIPVFSKTLLYALENNWGETEVAYIIHMMVLFIRWSMFVAKPLVRKELTKKLYLLCSSIPSRYVKCYRRILHPGRDTVIYLYLLRHPVFYRILSNCHVVEAGENMYHRLEKIRRHR